MSPFESALVKAVRKHVESLNNLYSVSDGGRLSSPEYQAILRDVSANLDKYLTPVYAEEEIPNVWQYVYGVTNDLEWRKQIRNDLFDVLELWEHNLKSR